MTTASAQPTLELQFINEILQQLKTQDHVPLTQILQTGMNLLMQAERQVHLDANVGKDKANGYLYRKLGTPMGELNLAVPRDRDGDFRPSLLPEPYQRDYQDRQDLIESLMINGYSPNQIAATLQQLKSSRA